jgi:sortase A
VSPLFAVFWRDVLYRRLVKILAVVLVCAGIYVLGFVPYALFVSHHSAVAAQDRLQGVLAKGLKTKSLPLGSADSSIPRVRWPKEIPAGTPIARLSIPSAGILNDVVVEGAQKVQLEEGPGHYAGTAMPGNAGNVALAGHRTTWLHPFYNLPSVGIGDRIVLEVGKHVWVYRVVDRAVVSPTDVSVLQPLRGWYITLTTCTPLYSAADRFVIRGVLSRRATFAANASVHSSVPSNVQVRSLPSSKAVLPAVPGYLLPIWLGLAACCVLGAFVVARRVLAIRVVLLVLAGVAAFESYGVALNLLPRTW